MKPEAVRRRLEQTYGMNLTLFEALGWEYLAPTKEVGSFVVAPESLPRWRRARQVVYCDDIPKFDSDLSDARTAWVELTKRKGRIEGVLSYETLAVLNLCAIVCPSKTPAPFDPYHPKAVAAMLKATPAQLCAALARTFNL